MSDAQKTGSLGLETVDLLGHAQLLDTVDLDNWIQLDDPCQQHRPTRMLCGTQASESERLSVEVLRLVLPFVVSALVPNGYWLALHLYLSDGGFKTH